MSAAWQLFTVAAIGSAPPDDVSLEVDYAAFLSRADMVWEWDGTPERPAPQGWWSMAFTGNGMLGIMVTADNGSAGGPGPLRFEAGRTDVIDDRMPGSQHALGNSARCDRPRLPIGYFELVTRGAPVSGRMRLRLWDAEVEGSVTTTAGYVNFTILTHALKDINVVNARGGGGEAVQWVWVPRQGDSVWRSQCRGYVGNPKVTSGASPNSHVNYTTQRLLSGAQYSAGYTVRQEPDGSTTLLSSVSQPMSNANSPGSASELTVIANVRTGLSLGWAALQGSHRRWWHGFYPASFLTLSDSKLEAFYWAQLYKLASATRGDKVAPTYGGYDHTGPWFTSSATCCPLFNWDMNMPVQYQMISSSNHPELGLSLVRLLSDPIVEMDLATNVDWIVTNSTASDPDLVLSAPHGMSSFRMLNDGGVRPPDYSCNLLWALVNYWNLYRATGDTALLPDLYTLLRGAVSHQLHLAVVGDDGGLHLPEMRSPEYPLPVTGGDTTYQLALLKWGLRTLLQVCDELGCDDPGRPRFEGALARLPDFATSDAAVGRGRGLQVSRNTAFTTSHRHYSHLLPCWNTGLIDPRSPLCVDSLDNWHAGQSGAPTEDMTWEWDGFSYSASASYNAHAGRAEAAYGNLTLMLNTVWPKRSLNWSCPHDGPAWPGSKDTGCIGAAMQPNTFQGENGGDSHADPTSETPLSMAAAVQDMLLVSDDAGGALRVFPATPAALPDAAFHRLRAAGAVLVSARRDAGVARFVRVESLLGGNCTVEMPPEWAGRALAASPPSVRLAAAGAAYVVGPLPPGGHAVIAPAAAPPADLTIRAARGEPAHFNWWGQHPGGAGRD